MNSSISHIVSHYTSAMISFHNEIKCKIFNKENTIITQSSTKEGMQHTMTGSISYCAASIGLSSFSPIDRLTTESSLVNFSFSGSGKWHTVGFKLKNSGRCFTSHVLNSILITKPITTLDGVIEMPSPVVLVHVAQSGVDTTLGCYGM